MPGDIVIADDDGAVVVPIKFAPELAEKATEHAEWEVFSRMKLAEGGDLRKYYPSRTKRGLNTRRGKAVRGKMDRGLRG